MNMKRLSLTVALTALIAGCAVPPTTPPSVSTGKASTNTVIQDADYLLSLARSAQPIRAAELKTQAAEQLIARGELDRADRILAGIDTAILPPSLQFTVISLRARQALSNQQGEAALGYLANMPSLSTLPDNQARLSESLYADAYQLNGQPLDEAMILIESTTYVHDEAERQAIHDRIWNALQSTDNQTLYEALQRPNNNYNLQGWLELAQAARTVSNIESNTNNIDNWLNLWQAHPAALLMPSNFNAPVAIADLINVSRIGIMLPSTGKLASVASAIQEGIMTAHYANQSATQPPELIFIDSSYLDTPEQIIQAAQEKGVELVIGPLDKDKVIALSQSALPLPFLALNYANTGAQNLYQFGLSAEDEARDAATQALNNGKRYALVITPETDWGERAAAAFRETFTQLGGTIVAETSFNSSNLSQKVAQLLKTDDSKARARSLRQITGLNFEFEERRRQDADTILMAARPQDARLIKPLLAFYFAADLPIYATSQVYSGQANPRADIDLNGIMFGETPWVLLPPSQNQQTLAAIKDNTGTRFGRLYAMGIDAYNLYPYLSQLRSTPGGRLNGETGQLSVNELNQVNRHLQWAIFEDGIPKLID